MVDAVFAREDDGGAPPPPPGAAPLLLGSFEYNVDPATAAPRQEFEVRAKRVTKKRLSERQLKS